jgi:hypothetical protein
MSTPTTKTTALADRYLRSDDYATLVEGITLAPEVWAVFAHLEQPHSAAELAAKTQLDIEAVQASLRRLVRRKLIRKHVLGWRDYAASQPLPVPVTAPAVAAVVPAPVMAPVPPVVATPVVAVAPLPEVVAVVAPTVAPVVVAASVVAAVEPAVPVPVVPAVPVVRPVTFCVRIGAERPRRPVAAPLVQLRLTSASPALRVATVTAQTVEFSPSPATDSATDMAVGPATSAAPAMATASGGESGWRLRPVMDAIGAKAGGGLAGQLLVYRVFLQVPPELMQAGGLHSLSLVDDHFSVTHAPLRSAIIDAARTHADVEIDALLVA